MSKTLKAVEEINEEMYDAHNGRDHLPQFVYSTDGNSEDVSVNGYVLHNSEDSNRKEGESGFHESMKDYLKRVYNNYADALTEVKFDL